MRSYREILAISAITLLFFVLDYTLINYFSGFLGAVGSFKENSVRIPVRYPEPFALSPDGYFIARYRTRNEGTMDIGPSFSVEIWDVLSSKLVSTIPIPPFHALPGHAGTWFADPNQVQYCNNGKYLLATDEGGKFYVFSAESGQMRNAIDFNKVHLAAAPEGVEPALAQTGADYVNVACAANGPIAAFLLKGGRFGKNGVIEVFDLDSGQEFEGFDQASGGLRVQSIALSPSGARLAILRYETFEYAGITVFDVGSRSVLTTISFEPDLGRDWDNLEFAGEHRVTVAVTNLVQLWDIDHDALIRTISDPNADNFKFKGLSAGGHRLLALSSRTHFCRSCNLGTGQQKVDDARFTLWDVDTGALVARSRSLKVVHHRCWLGHGGGLFNCTTFDEPPQLGLSQNGEGIVSSYGDTGEPFSVYHFASR